MNAREWSRLLLVTVLIGVAVPALADDVSEATELACALQMAASCDLDGDCLEGVPMEWNVPGFVVVDLESGRLSTTAEDPNPRTSAVPNLRREGGLIFLQGVENERAFSIIIDEGSGLLSATIAAVGFNVSIFGSCTPLPIAPASSGNAE